MIYKGVFTAFLMLLLFTQAAAQETPNAEKQDVKIRILCVFVNAALAYVGAAPGFQIDTERFYHIHTSDNKESGDRK